MFLRICLKGQNELCWWADDFFVIILVYFILIFIVSEMTIESVNLVVLKCLPGKFLIRIYVGISIHG